MDTNFFSYFSKMGGKKLKLPYKILPPLWFHKVSLQILFFWKCRSVISWRLLPNCARNRYSFYLVKRKWEVKVVKPWKVFHPIFKKMNDKSKYHLFCFHYEIVISFIMKIRYCSDLRIGLLIRSANVYILESADSLPYPCMLNHSNKLCWAWNISFIYFLARPFLTR